MGRNDGGDQRLKLFQQEEDWIVWSVASELIQDESELKSR